MGSENSLWVLVAPEGEVGRDQMMEKVEHGAKELKPNAFW